MMRRGRLACGINPHSILSMCERRTFLDPDKQCLDFSTDMSPSTHMWSKIIGLNTYWGPVSSFVSTCLFLLDDFDLLK